MTDDSLLLSNRIQRVDQLSEEQRRRAGVYAASWAQRTGREAELHELLQQLGLME